MAGKLPVDGRRIDRAQYRHTVFDQGDIDGEFAIAADKFLGAVERIDQPEASARDIGNVACGNGFFGDDRYVWSQLAQPLHDQGFSGFVGSCTVTRMRASCTHKQPWLAKGGYC